MCKYINVYVVFLLYECMKQNDRYSFRYLYSGKVVYIFMYLYILQFCFFLQMFGVYYEVVLNIDFE